ncbi:hypothetical protein LWI29_037296 [Acer saccharum]|uniref:Jacalin-type lectin domain-containing protein n=1 Tax=Acer saccharum TaxID=4024 RepID=A0AA39SYX7_ACESA|nr:hypothetical protein LWI29_037296 [Acer saccharum]
MRPILSVKAPPISLHVDLTSTSQTQQSGPLPSPSLDQQTVPIRSHHMITHLKSGVIRPRAYASVSDNLGDSAETTEEALTQSRWHEAMIEEYLASVYQSSIKVGPWGGLGGTEWSYMPKGGIVEIVINHGNIIDSLSFKSVCADKEAESSINFGGEGGNKSQISIDWPEEYLTSISGTTGKFYTFESCVKSLTFYTNWHTYGPFGSSKGTHFSLPVENRVIVGFHGRAGLFMEAIGVYQKAATSIQGHFMTRKVCQSSIEVGPWGGLGGTRWSYKPKGGIVEIKINHGVTSDSKSIIVSLSFKSVCANKEAESSSNFGSKRGKNAQRRMRRRRRSEENVFRDRERLTWVAGDQKVLVLGYGKFLFVNKAATPLVFASDIIRHTALYWKLMI